MRNKILFSIVFFVAAAGCSSTNSSGQKSSQSDDSGIPTAVKAAFYSEHPHAEMNDPKSQSRSDGSTIYEIPYTRADGSKGIATYSPMGELLNNE